MQRETLPIFIYWLIGGNNSAARKQYIVKLIWQIVARIIMLYCPCARSFGNG